MTPPPCLVVSSVTNFPIVMNNDFPMTNLPLPPRSRHLPVRHLSVFVPGAVHVGQGVPLLPQGTVHVDQGALGGSHIQHVTVTFIRSTAFHESSSFSKSLMQSLASLTKYRIMSFKCCLLIKPFFNLKLKKKLTLYT